MNNKKLYLIFKRIFDVIFALLLLLFTSPIMIITAIVIKLESKGSIFFRQDRPGYKTNIFRVIKFRTMKIKIEKDGKSLSDMERTTKIGNILRKTSIDELPQLFNIIKGDMSFIGPRPLLVRYLNKYTQEQTRRHEVKPGISGWAQVNGRNTISWESKFKYDVWYVDNMSFLVDFKIFILTILKIITKKGINSDIATTMKEFKGTKNDR